MKRLGRRKRGIKKERWDDCVKRNLVNAGEDDTWGKKAAVMEKWKGIITETVQQYMY